MKRCLFLIVLLSMVFFSSVSSVYAEEVVMDNGIRCSFEYYDEFGYDYTTYYFEVINYDSPFASSSVVVYYYDSNNKEYYATELHVSSYIHDDDGNFVSASYDGKYVGLTGADIDRFVVQFYYGNTERYQLTGTLVERIEPTLTPTPTPKPTSTPVPTPTNTPTPKPTSTPVPTPTNTPTPKPTSTPVPTPTEAPLLELNAFSTSQDAVAQYKTGGCTPVKSVIEFYEVDSAGVTFKVNSEEFISGSGTMRNTMTPGKVYRYKLTYIFQRDGIQYEKFIWSDDLSIVDWELEEYRSNKKITNFRTLMLYLWEDLMKLELPIEGYHISFQTLFIWVMVALAIVAFFKWYNN